LVNRTHTQTGRWSIACGSSSFSSHSSNSSSHSSSRNITQPQTHLVADGDLGDAGEVDEREVEDVGAVDLEVDGLGRDALVLPRQPVRLLLDLLPARACVRARVCAPERKEVEQVRSGAFPPLIEHKTKGCTPTQTSILRDTHTHAYTSGESGINANPPDLGEVVEALPCTMQELAPLLSLRRRRVLPLLCVVSCRC
jgi:hypothetical protein